MKTIQPHIARQRARHWAALSALHTDPQTPGLGVWRALRRVEQAASRDSVAYCNGEIGPDQWETRKERHRAAVARALGGTLPPGFFVNGDPRGYALKIDPERGTVPDGMYTDWGRYGILAPLID